MANLTDKVAIVTGAASGIGKAIAERYARDGAKLVLGDLDTDALERMADEFDTATVPVQCDVSDNEACKALVQTAIDRFGRIDILVNNAGVDHLGKIDEGDFSAFAKVIETDLYGVVQMSHAAIAHLRESKGCIINMSSVSGIGGDWNHSFYCAAKGGVTNFTRALALDEAANGVRVNALNPSYTITPLTEGMRDKPDLVEGFRTRIPMGRGAEPEEVAAVASFLAGEDARFVTGVNLPVDGGLSAANGQPALK